jgi:hypothetical protein
MVDHSPNEDIVTPKIAGGSATGIQRSPNLECPNFHMGVRLGSKSCIENTSKFASEKFGISLAHQVRVAESRSAAPKTG